MDSLFKRFQCDGCGRVESIPLELGSAPLPAGWRQLDLAVRMAGVAVQHQGHACSTACAAALAVRWVSVPDVGPHDMFLEA